MFPKIMAQRVINHWPSLFLTIVLFIGIGACFGCFDNVIVDEMRALISIMFGFASTCLLLTYVWIVQRKPQSVLWHQSRLWSHNRFLAANQSAFGAAAAADVPNMHPRGRSDSVDSEETTGATLSSISASLELDKPPKYEDALLSSKPIKKRRYSHKIPSDMICDCSTNSKMSIIRHQESVVLEPHPNQCLNCSKYSPNSRVRQFAMNFVKGFSPHESSYHLKATHGHQLEHQSIQSDDGGQASNVRKVSYIQLDVHQLMLSSSPPKYSDLIFGPSSSNNTNHQHFLPK